MSQEHASNEAQSPHVGKRQNLEVDRALHSLPAVEGAVLYFAPKAFGAILGIE
jgi:hypothetical protein